MKFTEGVWCGRENITLSHAVEVSTLITSSDRSIASSPFHPIDRAYIEALCTTRHIRHRGDMINKPVLNLKLTSPSPGIVGLEISHFQGKSAHKELVPSKLLEHSAKANGHGSLSSVSCHDGEYATLDTGAGTATLDVRPDSFGVEFRNQNGEKLVEIGKASASWILNTAASPFLAIKENASQTIHDPYYRAPAVSRQSYMSLAMGLEPGELVYGLGERFGPFIKNGQVIESSNEDGGTSSDSAYKCIPFYLTNRNYGVLVDHYDHVSFEVQSDRMTKVQMSVPGEVLRVYIFLGESPKQVLELYTRFSGRPPLPPDWSYGLWLSTSFLTSYDEKTVMSYIDGMEQRNIPLHVFHFDAYWMKPHTWCDMQFDPEFFPDVKGFLSRIHSRGVKVCVWLNPMISQYSRLFEEGDQKGYFVKRLDGSTFQSDAWQPGCATVDFTNPDATEWWQGHLGELCDLGVDVFKTDFGERIPTEGVKYFDGTNPRTMHNAYAFLYQKVTYEVLERKRGPDQACVFARSATLGTNRFPVHWSGDVDSTFTGLAETVRGGLSLGLSGFGYHSSDIGGFKSEGKNGGDSGAVPPGVLYKRWCQFGLLSSHSRLHGSGSSRVPWSIDDEASEVLSKFTLLKNRLEPYFTSTSILGACRLGHPVMRPMLLEFPSDRSAWSLDMQYMLGESMLVAPIFGESNVEYYVPEGRWTNLLDGKEKQGPKWLKEEYDMFGLPLLVREGHALLIGQEGHRVEDSLTSRGATLVITRHGVAAKIVTLETRGGPLQARIEQQIEQGVLTSIKGEIVGGKTPLEIIVIGNGKGLDQGGIKRAEGKAGVCTVQS